MATVTWSSEPQSDKGDLTCRLELQFTDYVDFIEPWIYAVAQPNQFQEADANGNIIVVAGTTTATFTSSDSRGWWADEYHWTFSPVGGTTETFTTSTPVKSLSMTGTEYGPISIAAYNEHCDQTSSARTANIVRKLALPVWNSIDEIMCNNTTSTFSINSVPEAISYYWEATGGFTIWNGSSYVTSFSTTSTSVTVKSRSTNGGGSISVTAKRSGTNVLDSETLFKDLWSGIFIIPYVTGTPDVCPNSLYVYTALIPVGNPSSYSYEWNYPSGWYKNGQWDNNIQLRTPQYNMTYGTVRVSITNECGSSVYSGITVYPGYCGGYYMAFPNPSSSYVDIDVNPKMSTSMEEIYNNDISLSLYNKMGTVVHNSNVESLPYRIDTSGLPNGEYVVKIITRKKGGTEKDQRFESLKITVNH